MSSKNVSIIVIESSQIIFEGIAAILNRSGQPVTIFRAENLSDFQTVSARVKADVVFLNPSIVQNQIKEFLALKKDNEMVVWIAIVYAFLDTQSHSLFDDLIYINDRSDRIISLMSNLLLARNQANGYSNNLESLSDRELDVLKLLVAGNANKEIADKLNISSHTVISHRKNIAQKTGIKSVAGLTIYAVVNKIIYLDTYRE